MSDWIPHLVLLVLFVATLIRSAFGFGEALVAVPLLALALPVEVAAPLATLTSIAVAAVVLLQDWADVHVRSARRLVLATILGIPFGLLMLIHVSEPVIKSVLALAIISFSAYSLRSRPGSTLRDDRWAWLFGLGAGVLGGAYGMNGPPLVVYGALRGWTPRQFRATLQGYFLPASMMVMAGYGLAGLWTTTVMRYFLLALPAVLVAIFLGRIINRRMRGPQFLVYLHVGLIVIAGILLVQALT